MTIDECIFIRSLILHIVALIFVCSDAICCNVDYQFYSVMICVDAYVNFDHNVNADVMCDN